MIESFRKQKAYKQKPFSSKLKPNILKEVYNTALKKISIDGRRLWQKNNKNNFRSCKNL